MCFLLSLTILNSEYLYPKVRILKVNRKKYEECKVLALLKRNT